MSQLALQRCLNHSFREAVARCPECSHSYCRECITEHDDRVICAGCLKKLLIKTGPKRSWFKPAWSFLQNFLAILSIWLFFFTIAKALLAIPASFHEGSVWKSSSGVDE